MAEEKTKPKKSKGQRAYESDVAEGNAQQFPHNAPFPAQQ
jgi:hypothetical protein